MDLQIQFVQGVPKTLFLFFLKPVHLARKGFANLMMDEERVVELLRQRFAARALQNYPTADLLRDELGSKYGIDLNDRYGVRECADVCECERVCMRTRTCTVGRHTLSRHTDFLIMMVWHLVFIQTQAGPIHGRMPMGAWARKTVPTTLKIGKHVCFENDQPPLLR